MRVHAKYWISVTICLIFLAGFQTPALCGWADTFKKVLGGDDSSETAQTTTNKEESSKVDLSDFEMNGGIKDALNLAVDAAVTSLGQQDGYLGNSLVKIAMPEKLVQVEQVLRQLGQGKLVDDFITSMNRAAEQAVPKTTRIFGDAITSMTIEEATQILQGEDNAVTQYFETKTRTSLDGEIKPVIAQATDAVMVTKYYKAMMAKAGSSVPFLQNYNPDLDQYVTDKALDGLFVIMAQEEKKIRENPAARTTDLVKKVFDYFGN